MSEAGRREAERLALSADARALLSEALAEARGAW
jgi:hypothetical protein